MDGEVTTSNGNVQDIDTGQNKENCSVCFAVNLNFKGAGGGPLPKILNFNFIAFLDRVDLPLYPSFFRM